MNILHTTTYKLHNKDNIKISILSDIHFNYNYKKKLDKLLKHINKIKPNYILIPGDLIDSTDIIENINEKNIIINWLKKISKKSKVIISLGNHDVYKIRKKRILKNRFKYLFPSHFINEIKKINNIYVLNNNKYEDNLIYIVGLTGQYCYYNNENIDILLNNIKNNEKIITNLPNDKLKLFMFHSPVNLNNKMIKDELKEFDYFISGHMHNGCVPPIISELWNSNKGIISPLGKLFQENERNTLNKNEDKLIVNGPVITFSKHSGIMHIFNIFYPIYNTVLEFNNKNEFTKLEKYHK